MIKIGWSDRALGSLVSLPERWQTELLPHLAADSPQAVCTPRRKQSSARLSSLLRVRSGACGL